MLMSEVYFIQKINPFSMGSPSWIILLNFEVTVNQKGELAPTWAVSSSFLVARLPHWVDASIISSKTWRWWGGNCRVSSHFQRRLYEKYRQLMCEHPHTSSQLSCRWLCPSVNHETLVQVLSWTPLSRVFLPKSADLLWCYQFNTGLGCRQFFFDVHPKPHTRI